MTALKFQSKAKPLGVPGIMHDVYRFAIAANKEANEAEESEKEGKETERRIGAKEKMEVAHLGGEGGGGGEGEEEEEKK